MILFLFFVAVVSIFALLIRKQYSYWDRCNLPHIKTEIPWGAFGPSVKEKRPFGLVLSDIYNASTEKVLGIYVLFQPILLVRDAHLARQILTSDFSSFHDRGVYLDEKHNSLATNLFNLKGQNWRNVRRKLAPSFTSGKLKAMFETIDDIGNKLVKHLNMELAHEKEGGIIDLNGLITTYAIDSIASVIFGLDVDSFTDPNNEFNVIQKNISYRAPFLGKIFELTSVLCPTIAKLIFALGYRNKNLQKMRDLIKRTIELREKHNVMRKDLLQLLIQLRNTGEINENNDKVWDAEAVSGNAKAMSLDEIAANAFLFYAAGSETTAATASFTIYELSMYPELLKRARKEVLDVLECHNLKPNGNFTYEAMNDMKFLELCIMEAARKYPGLPFLNRQCTEDFQIPDTKLTIRKGTMILISLLGIHRDSKYFPDPTLFNPERFLDDSLNYDSAAYMPFGEGPRHCIAQRMGKMNTKLAVAKILANFDVETKERMELSFGFNAAPSLMIDGGLKVRLTQRI